MNTPAPLNNPAAFGAILVAAGSGIVALINARNIELVLIFAVIFFLGFLAVVFLVAETAGDDNDRGDDHGHGPSHDHDGPSRDSDPQ